jgi:RimJ/RimL family protein N-acetyltransferase
MGLASHATELLGSRAGTEVSAFLHRDPPRNVYLLWRLGCGILDGSEHERLLGVRDAERELVALLGLGANMVPAGDALDALAELGASAACMTRRPRMLIGPEAGVLAAWQGYQRFARPRVELDTRHVYYELRRADLSPALGLEDLRLAQPSDLLEIEEASASMLLEDLGRRDRDEDPALFRRRVRHAIALGEVYLARRRGRFVFKANIGARAAGVAQIQGVYTTVAERGQGYCRRGCAELSRRLFDEGVEVVNLFVREDNLPARQAYESIGFRPAGHFRMIILEREGRRR